MALDPRVVKEIKKCRRNFRHFCKYLRIVNKSGKLMVLKPNSAQRRFLKAQEDNPHTYVLKARQLGLTTIIAAYNFWKAALNPNHRVLVIAHTHEAAESIFKIYRRFYLNLPSFMQAPTIAANVREIEFSHGGLIKVTSAGSGSARGSTYNSIHCSEFAFYKDINETVASAFQTAADDATIVLETTANGINEAHKMWFDTQVGYGKLFIAWTDDRGYVSTKRAGTPPTALADYKDRHGLTDKQFNWAVQTFKTKCASDWNTFRQEYPLLPEQAFITSGARFFVQSFPHVGCPEGYIQYEPPKPYAVYSIGVDTASGSPIGDYSAYMVMDVTDKAHPRIVASYYDRVSPSTFAQQLLNDARAYHALVTVESNSYGLSVIEYLVHREWAFLYRRTKYDKVGDRWTEMMGFNTNSATRSLLLSRLQEFIGNGWLKITDDRLKYEMNTFMFNADGKAEAANGKHDDMVFACALTLVGMDQIDQVEEEVLRVRPRNVKEILQFEMSTGRLYEDSADEFAQEPVNSPQLPSDTLF